MFWAQSATKIVSGLYTWEHGFEHGNMGTWIWNSVIIWHRLSVWQSPKFVFRDSINKWWLIDTKETLTFNIVRFLGREKKKILIRRPGSRTETRHVVTSGMGRVDGDNAGHRGHTDVTRMTIQPRVSTVEDDLIHSRTASSHRTSQVVSRSQQFTICGVTSYLWRLHRRVCKTPGYKVWPEMTLCKSNWTLESA